MRLFYFITLGLLSIGCAKRVDEMEARLEAIDERTRGIEGKRSATAEGQNLADIRAQLSTNSNDLKNLLGRIEDIEIENKQLKQDIKALKSDLESKREDLEKKSFVASQAAESSAEGDYNIALRAHQNGKFEEARQLFNAFLIKYPSSSLADNAIYWMGDEYFQEKKYKLAITRFQDLIEKFPKSDKRCDALGRQIASLEKLNLTKEAAAFREVKTAECKEK